MTLLIVNYYLFGSYSLVSPLKYNPVIVQVREKAGSAGPFQRLIIRLNNSQETSIVTSCPGVR